MAETFRLRAGADDPEWADAEAAVADDATLAARGDVEAFIRLYRAHLMPVYRYLYVRLGDAGDAEDVTQQVFERVWSSLGSFKPVPGGSFKGWLVTIARRALIDHTRERKLNREYVALDTLADQLVDPALEPEAAAMLAEQVQLVMKVIDDLPEEGREVITLRFMAELSYGEIARIMGKKEPAVKMAAYRALDIIRRKWRNGDV